MLRGKGPCYGSTPVVADEHAFFVPQRWYKLREVLHQLVHSVC